MNMDLPAKYKLHVTPVAGVDAGLVEIGMQYWSLTGIDQYGAAAWATPVRDIDTHGRGAANVVAAAAVRAVLQEVQCCQCGEQLRLRTRSSLTSVLSEGSTHCVDCDPKLLQRSAAILVPEGQASRRSSKDQVQREQRQQQKQHKQHLQKMRQCGLDLWHHRQLNAIREEFLTELPIIDVPNANILTELATLTLLRFAEDTDPIPPMRQWIHPFPFHSGNRKISTLINDIRSAGLLLPDSTTPPNVFVWEPPDFDEEWSRADGELENLPFPKLTDRYYPIDTFMRIPFDQSSEAGRDRLDSHLSERLAPRSMTAQRQQEMVEVIHEILATEAIRFFLRELERHNLPEVTENHAPRLTEAAERLVAENTLGFAYFLGWKAAKTAAAAAQANRRAPLRNMTTYAVNTFERDVQHALDKHKTTIREFDESPYFPLAAMTKTLFFTALQMDPMRTSVAMARDAMPIPVIAEPLDESPLPEREYQPDGFRRGSSSWIEFAGDSSAKILLRASRYLLGLEKLMPFLAVSMHWETFPSEYDTVYSLRIELDGVDEACLPLEGNFEYRSGCECHGATDRAEQVPTLLTDACVEAPGDRSDHVPPRGL
ncbi:hypothetical protein [Actinoalloteichus sp. GBA129-24]|uniref:hypothetical protein n=1 Tax=Actinoalloteichus sp. GBA129-24 TaxID=1612551 RepID=UPI0009508E4B|nr:hypothetical protein [Actinoalloteichus sp. GBA129-24]APU21271.1 hypothetical protein UA75_16315 [Actinoalloteichus sp. GBA129-24]